MMFWYGGHMSGWGYALGIIAMVLFWGLLIAAVVAAARFLGRSREGNPPQPPSAAHPSQPTAEQLLAERFARGEIDAEEYQHRLDTLHAATGSPGDR